MDRLRKHLNQVGPDTPVVDSRNLYDERRETDDQEAVEAAVASLMTHTAINDDDDEMDEGTGSQDGEPEG